MGKVMLLLVIITSMLFVCIGTANFAEEDITPPVLYQISVDKTSVTVGEVFWLSVGVEDDISGVASVSAMYISPSQGQTKYVDLSYDSLADVYLGAYTVGQYDELGEWNVHYVRVTDIAGNVMSYNYGVSDFDLSPANIEFVGTTPDTLAPTLHSISVDKLWVTVDEVFTLTVNVQDDVSGVASVSAMYISPSKGQTKHVDLSYDSMTDVYLGAYTVGQYDEPGEWNVHYVRVADFAGNVMSYNYGVSDLDLSPANIEFVGTTPDTSAPTLHSISVDKSEVSVDEVFTLTVNVQDNVSGVASVSAMYISPSQGQTKYVDLSHDSADAYLGAYTVGQYDELGIWNVHYVRVTDFAGNVKSYNYGGPDFDLSPANIEFVAMDSVAPTIVVNIESGSILPKGSVLELYATDEDSGVKSVEATLTNGTEAISIESPYVLVDGVYTLEIVAKDNCDNIAYTTVDFVVYDPECASVNGGGSYFSEAGYYVPNPNLVGTVNFSFVSKYNKKESELMGQLSFEIPFAGMILDSISYDWLLVSDTTAQFKGSGTINGEGLYGFIITAIDGKLDQGNGDDYLMIRIWDKNNTQMIYDNYPGSLIKGNITVHKK